MQCQTPLYCAANNQGGAVWSAHLHVVAAAPRPPGGERADLHPRIPLPQIGCAPSARSPCPSSRYSDIPERPRPPLCRVGRNGHPQPHEGQRRVATGRGALGRAAPFVISSPMSPVLITGVVLPGMAPTGEECCTTDAFHAGCHHGASWRAENQAAHVKCLQE